MVKSIRLIILLSALVSAYGHTRGAANWEEEEALKLTRDRKLKKDMKKKNLLTGNPSGGGGGGGGGGGSNDKKKNDNKKKNGGKNDKNDKQGSNGNGGGGVTENHDCVPFNAEMQGRASLSLSDDACRTNSCGGGCCRVYHWLICDTANEMPQLSCVCNENTKTLPTTPPQAVGTPQPTPALTAAATPQATPGATVKDGDGLSVPPEEASPGTAEPQPTGTPAPQPTGTPRPTPHNMAAQPANMGGRPSDSCTSGSAHHNNPLFQDFTKCFGASDCPMASECCIHSFCFCGEPDDWTGDCVARTSK